MTSSHLFWARGRRLAILGAASALTLGLAGCGGGDGGDTSGGGGGGGGDNTVTVWHYFSADNQVQVMDDFAKKFEAAHQGAKVENVYVPYDQMNSKVVSAAGNQTGPDIVVFNGAETATIALAGGLAPLDEQWGSYQDASQFPDAVLHVINDQTFSVQGYVNLLGLWYNADILDKIGVKPPTTIDELESAMAAAKKAGYSGITLSGLPQSQGEWQAYPWLTSQGWDYDNLDEDALAAGLAMARGWVEKGYLSREATTWDQTVPFQEFTGGDVAFAANGNWQIGTAKADAKFKYGVVPLPVGDQGKVYLGGEGVGIGAFADDPDLAWEYLTETYLDQEGEVMAAKNVGYIPARSDAGQDPAVTKNPLLAPFAQSLADNGANYPAANIPPEAVADVQTAMGQTWSAVLGGQRSPDQAAADVTGQLQSVIGQ
jgi:ABC-type glycerol-3-phosphate transport system substrate-binding protein